MRRFADRHRNVKTLDTCVRDAPALTDHPAKGSP